MKQIAPLTVITNTAHWIEPGVYLIGAGPGASDLITVRGARILGNADIVFYDALIDISMLEWCPRTKLVQVGKRCGSHSSSQHFINKQLVDAAGKYSVVVRLKGGDPMIFGRAQEEIDALEKANVPYEIVPGITTALAASAELKQPPTTRELSRTLTLTTLPGRCAHEDHKTAIYYMSRDQLSEVATTLIANGYKADTPVCLMESVSLPAQRSFGCTLDGLRYGDVHHQFLDRQPVVVMVGEVYRKKLHTLTPFIESQNYFKILQAAS
ncbi:uroporphyrinogen-III C-methyltransferase [Polynucleobacter sp. MWH-Braz-FAM2G]|uniref:uroporphyrinogen-III C-methyltransferase n=1 Tax=Polynucleobacter sp. MWH-Braz-FAM2G TaxID=1855883 RepID=UPI001BFD56F0|nr:uroporphyrinogen-III C-methyltransferase [Polynucleobacter sp. MWH-Braz-FAM2G]QWD90186.1 uroporphyrinogen-III C-methyltransferase [Polynucleobacter sp. MWH-Braz-FAM2G]